MWSNLLTFLPDPPPPPRVESPSRSSRYARDPVLLSLPHRSTSRGATQRGVTVLPPLRIDTSLVAQHGQVSASPHYRLSTQQKETAQPEEELSFMKRLARATAQRRQQLLTTWTKKQQPSSPSLPSLPSPQKLAPLHSPVKVSIESMWSPQKSASLRSPQKVKSLRLLKEDGLASPRKPQDSGKSSPVPPARSMPPTATPSHHARSTWLKSPILTEDEVAGPPSSDQTSAQRAQAIASTCEQLKKWLVKKVPPVQHDVSARGPGTDVLAACYEPVLICLCRFSTD